MTDLTEGFHIRVTFSLVDVRMQGRERREPVKYKVRRFIRSHAQRLERATRNSKGELIYETSFDQVVVMQL
jgi:hypothetical protein